jgi:hypothetical protein
VRVGERDCVKVTEGLPLIECCPERLEQALARPERVGVWLEVELALLLPQEEGLPESVSRAESVRGTVPDMLLLALLLGLVEREGEGLGAREVEGEVEGQWVTEGLLLGEALMEDASEALGKREGDVAAEGVAETLKVLAKDCVGVALVVKVAVEGAVALGSWDAVEEKEGVRLIEESTEGVNQLLEEARELPETDTLEV